MTFGVDVQHLRHVTILTYERLSQSRHTENHPVAIALPWFKMSLPKLAKVLCALNIHFDKIQDGGPAEVCSLRSVLFVGKNSNKNTNYGKWHWAYYSVHVGPYCRCTVY